MTDPCASAGARILLVDDEPDHVDMYRLALQNAGFEIVAAYTGGDALRRARELAPDLIVLDVRLPDMTGWEVCGALKADRQTAHVPIVVLTAAATPTLAEDAVNAGCADFLLKPCYPDQLMSSIRTVLQIA